MLTSVRLVFLLLSIWRISRAQIEGEIRLTGGLNSSKVGRLEVFLNGAWGAVSNIEDDKNASFSFGETVCYQLNNFYGITTKVVSGTVSSVNKVLKDEGKKEIDVSGLTNNIAMYDLDCSSGSKGGLPQHVLRCSYKPSDGSRKDHKNDLAVICDNIVRKPFIGQVRINGADSKSVSSGTLEIFAGKYWGNICSDGFDGNAADTSCRQLGYTNAKMYVEALAQSGSTIWLDDAACGANSNSSCLWNCLSELNTHLIYKNVSKYCLRDSYVSVNCEFNKDIASKSDSPGIGNACQIPEQKLSWVVIIILVIIFVVFLVIMLTILAIVLAICCCCFNFCLCPCGAGCGTCCKYSAV